MWTNGYPVSTKHWISAPVWVSQNLFSHSHTRFSVCKQQLQILHVSLTWWINVLDGSSCAPPAKSLIWMRNKLQTNALRKNDLSRAYIRHVGDLTTCISKDKRTDIKLHITLRSTLCIRKYQLQFFPSSSAVSFLKICNFLHLVFYQVLGICAYARHVSTFQSGQCVAFMRPTSNWETNM